MISCKVSGWWLDDFGAFTAIEAWKFDPSEGPSLFMCHDLLIVLFANGESFVGSRDVESRSCKREGYSLKIQQLLKNVPSDTCGTIAACTKGSFVYADDNGDVWSLGFTFDDTTCTGGDGPLAAVKLTLQPQPRSILQRMVVRQLAAGDSHILILTDCGSLYSRGSGRNGELGVGKRITFQDTAHEIKLPDASERVRYIACGGNFSAVISTPSNWVYTFGCGAYYRLGTGSDDDCLSPTKITELEGVGAMNPDGSGGFSGIKLIACGTWHAVAVAADTNDVYSWGWNKFGQCGAASADQKPRSINNNSRGSDDSSSTSSSTGISVSTTTNITSESLLKSRCDEIIATPRRVSELDAEALVGSGDDDRSGTMTDKYPGTMTNKYPAVLYDVTAVTCGSRHTAILTRNGRRVIVMGELGIQSLRSIAASSSSVKNSNTRSGGGLENINGPYKWHARAVFDSTRELELKLRHNNNKHRHSRDNDDDDHDDEGCRRPNKLPRTSDAACELSFPFPIDAQRPVNITRNDPSHRGEEDYGDTGTNIDTNTDTTSDIGVVISMSSCLWSLGMCIRTDDD